MREVILILIRVWAHEKLQKSTFDINRNQKATNGFNVLKFSYKIIYFIDFAHFNTLNFIRVNDLPFKVRKYPRECPSRLSVFDLTLSHAGIQYFLRLQH